MNEDEMLEGLGARARQQWSEQTAALDDGSVDGWTPLTEQETDDVIDAVLARLGDPSASPEPPISPPIQLVPKTRAEPTTPSAEPATPTGSGPSQRGRVVALFGAVLAVAAALILWRSSTPTVASLPQYDDAGFEAGTAMVRGDADATESVPRLRPDGELRWRLRPQTTVEGSVGLRVWAKGATSKCLDPSDAVRVSPQGAIELQGRVSEVLDLPAGEWSLTPIVGRQSQLHAMSDPCGWMADEQPAPPGLAVGPARRVRVEVSGVPP